jgi:hypothetical protein
VKVEIQAGAKIDILTPDEMKHMLRGWMAETIRGVKFIPFSGQIAKAGATFTIGPNTQLPAGNLGPAEGFYWAVMSVNVQGPGIAAADTFVIYDNDTSGTKVRVPNLTNAGKSFQKAEFVLPGPNRICVTGASTGAGNEIFVTGTAIEVPESLKWQLC